MTRKSISLVGTGILKTVFLTRAAAGFTFAIGLLCAIEARAVNVLTNPGFETTGLAGWTTFGPNNYSENTAGIAHGGVNYYKVYGSYNGAQNYTGIYQDNPAAPGAIYSADGWAYTLGSDGAFNYPHLLWPIGTRIECPVSLQSPRHMTVLPGGASLARAK